MAEPDAQAAAATEPESEIEPPVASADDAEAEAEPVVAVVAAASVLNFRERMATVQQQFADAPAAAVAQAELVVTDAVAALHGILLKNAVDLGGWRQSEDPEELRGAMQRYQEYLDKVLSVS